MSARNETLALMQRFGERGITLSFEHANTLRRAQITLHRWAELECGNDNGFIGRNEENNRPYFCTLDKNGDPRVFHDIPDREAGALRRVTAICKEAGLHYYHQTDPRGCALYVSNEPLSDNDYTRGVACC
jgi:hypothetical protein